MIARSLGVIAIALIVSLATMNAQTFDWARQGAGHGWKRGNTIAVDANGNSFVGGEFSGAPAGSGPFAISFGIHGRNARGNTDAFIVMHNPGGGPSWVHQIAKPVSSSAPEACVTVKSIAVHGGNTLYVTGDILGPIEFGGGTSSVSMVKTAEIGSSFIARYTYSSTNISPEWVVVLGPTATSNGSVESRSIAVDPLGNLYVCGTVKGAVEFRSISAPTGGGRLISSPNRALFAGRYAHTGDPIWVIASTTPPSGTGEAFGTAVAVDDIGGVYVTGKYSGDVVTLGTDLPAPAGNSNLLVASVAAGGFQWATAGTTSSSSGSFAAGNGIAADNTGGIYVVGDFRGNLDFPPSGSGGLGSPSTDFFVARFNRADGTLGWSTQGGVNVTGDARANGVALTPANPGPIRLLVTGTFAGRIKHGATTLVGMGNHDIFVVSYELDGTEYRAQRAGNYYAADNRNHDDKGIDVAVDGQGQIYVTGEFGSSTAGTPRDVRFFDTPGLHFDSHFRNVFVARMSPVAAMVSGAVRIDGIPQPNYVVAITNPGGNTDYVRTGDDGTYAIWIPADRTTGSYRVQAELSPYRDLNIPAPLPYYTIPSVGTSFSDRNFEFQTPQKDSVRDLAVTITAQGTGYAAAGTSLCYLIKYENLGVKALPGAKISLCYDERLLNARSTAGDPTILAPTVVALDCPGLMANLTWTLPSPLSAIGSGSSGEILVCFDTPVMDPGTMLKAYAEISNPVGDDMVSNNDSHIDQIVVEPSDPNTKMAMPEGKLSVIDVRAGMDLTYLISFFNKGPATALKVVVTDTLNPLFFGHDATGALVASDISVLSHSPVSDPAMTRSYDPAFHHAVFDFSSVSLLSQNESILGSHGFLTFYVPLRPSLAIGTVVRNRAWIVFDTQSPVETNWAESCVAPDFDVQNVCFGDATMFISYDSTSGTDYLPSGTSVHGRHWSFGDGDTSNAINPTHTYQFPGTYLVTLTYRLDSVGTLRQICDELDSVFVISKLVEISPVPVATVTRIGDTLYASPAAAYQWYGDATLLSGQTGPTLLLSDAPGYSTYKVVVSTSGGCEKTSDAFASVPVITPVDELSLTIGPNPGRDAFRIELAEGSREEIRLSVVDMRGVEVIRRIISRGTRAVEIDTRGYPAGVYTVQLDEGKRITTRKIVVQR